MVDGSTIRLVAMLVRACDDDLGHVTVSAHPETMRGMALAAKREHDHLLTRVRELEAEVAHWRSVAESRLEITPEDAEHFVFAAEQYGMDDEDDDPIRVTWEALRAHAEKAQVKPYECTTCDSHGWSDCPGCGEPNGGAR